MTTHYDSASIHSPAVHELREYLVTLTEMCYQSIGYRRVKNPRIWSMHDIAALTDGTE